MFGDLFEEDYSSVSNNHYGTGKTLKAKALEPPSPREITHLSGIRNQGGTCYLNSLLQTLHFTPEFREALFSLGPEELGSLEDKDKPDAKRLFAQLLLLDQEAASTADLTDSFGWTSNEEMRQHDVQELNRILFSALETSLEGTSGHDLINRLYHGTVVNQIVCKECKNVSEKQEDFLDLTVAVKNTSGLEDALWNMYVEEEVFDHDNLYHCGNCNRLVKAVKSAKLRKLPPFLTVSLLRFNFDFVKCERYKETSCYTFPPRINLKPFCEESELDDLEYIYDLFSVIIHKGGCYGGHYHVYIKDVDHLGSWQSQEEKSKPDANLKEEIQNDDEIDDPLTTLQDLLLQEEGSLIPVDHLGQKLLKKTGVSWNKKYRKQHGPLRKFLQLHPQIFLLNSDESTVHLLTGASPPTESASQRNARRVFRMPSSESSGPDDGTSCPHWFDINDSVVKPIKEKDIEQQFQGKESAYMLFYRKSQLQRPPEARANPRYKVPGCLLKEIDAANSELQARRAEYESATNHFKLHLHLGPHYHFFNGALHPVTSHTEGRWDLTIDKRKTVGDLRQSILELLEFWEGDLVLSVAKFVPAGLHVYQTLEGDDRTLMETEISDGEDIFVWNGVEVGGVQIPAGSDCEPLLLNVLHVAPSSDGEMCQQLIESQHVFPSNAELNSLFTALAIPEGVVLTNSTESTSEENWTTLPQEALKKTFREQGLRNGSSILIQDSRSEGNSLLTKHGKRMTGVNEINWVQVENLCPFECEEKHVRLTATVNTVVFDIRIKAIKELKLMKELAENSCLRPVSRTGKLLCPVPDMHTLEEAELKLGCSLGLCPGKAPTPSQLFLFFALGSDVQPGAEMEITVEETLSVRECLQTMLEKSGLKGDEWHLRRTDWCYEAGEPLCEEDATLKELKVCSGETLLIVEGRLPPPGFLKVPIWWYQPRGFASHGETQRDAVNSAPSQGGDWRATSPPGPPGDVPTDVALVFLGDLKVSEDTSLLELKAQAMTLPSMWKHAVPSPAFLRAWTVESRRPGRLLRSNRQLLREHKLGKRTEICLEPLQKEENLSPQDMLLRTRMHIPGERDYAPSVDLVWDAARGWSAASLRQCVAQLYALPAEKTRIAKHLAEKSQWLPISSWNQQPARRKKKQQQESLQGPPYFLKDGDTIGVKNLLVEDDDDFSTVSGEAGREEQRLALQRKPRHGVSRGRLSDSPSPTARRPQAHGVVACALGPEDQKLLCPSTSGASDSTAGGTGRLCTQALQLAL
ncbi:ubiquitin carboxyl-terminal hydrolase 40 isoform X3 [Erinaceus europaeus]|uniref:Ubiquitin carboxyl-terminal hydrolase 40 isoform X3 n=1 Tax=Erinaceus europaeus TaxID=9365 RepID=A0ABM3XLU3_ERIEU|nr:ubiquitin carboxyl-terminal hydrolase 40 isoform X3 [Erinaceus europaeus]